MLDISDALRATERVVAQHETAVRVALEAAGEIGVSEARGKPGFIPRNGLDGLQGSNKAKIVRTTGGKILRLYNDKKYAAAIDKGARPHRIDGNPFLYFMGRDGHLIRKRFVMHRGNRAYHFLRNATGTAHVRLEALLEREMQRVASNFGR